MSDEIKNITEDDNGTEEMNITVSFDDGDVVCAVVTIFECEDKDYIALLPLDETGNNEDGEVWLYGYSENPDDPNEEPELRYIEDDDEFEKVEEAFDEYLDTVEYDEILETEE